MQNPLARKLEKFAPISPEDISLLDSIVRSGNTIPAHRYIIGEGDAPDVVHLIVEGFACRYKSLRNGRRQIVGYLVPGDFCDLHVFILKQMDHSICTLAPCKVVEIARHRVLELLDRPVIARALWWVALVDEAVTREWLLNMGQRPADERIAHLLCELLLRLRIIGLTESDSFDLPITQEELADTMGLSTVHVNRSLQSLRAADLIVLKNKRLFVPDLNRLQSFSGFDPNYLHLTGGK